MIDHFEPAPRLEPEHKDHLQWIPAMGAGLIPGFILLLVPSGSPWSPLNFFSRVVMGRVIPDGWTTPLAGSAGVHLLLSLTYGLIIAMLVIKVTQWRAVMIGGFAGIVLYLINFAITSLLFPELCGNEAPVLLSHFVFGLVAAAAYRGLLRRQPLPATA